MKVAILIPTKNRPDFIERTLAYYDSLKSVHTVFIGDASGPEASARIAAAIKRLSNVEVRYFHWEDLGANQTLVKLAQEALRECQYCAFHGDDDFFVPSSLSKCAEFLSRNPSYRIAQGRAALMILDRSGPYGEIRGLGDYWGRNAVEEETSTERCISFEKKTFASQFSTHRTEEFLQDSQDYLEIKEPQVGELLHNFTFVIRGKSKFIDCLYLIRNIHEEISHPRFWDWILQEDWSSEYHKVLNSLSLALHESSDLSLSNAKKFVTKLLNEFMEKEGQDKSGVVLALSLSARLRSYLPLSLRSAIKDVVINDSRDMRLLRSRKSLFYYEFLPVRNSVSMNKLI
jgi:glycosyltransferase domain-containing protein